MFDYTEKCRLIGTAESIGNELHINDAISTIGESLNVCCTPQLGIRYSNDCDKTVVMNVDGKNDEFYCSCGKEFTSKNELKLHKMRCLGGQLAVWVCEKCGEWFHFKQLYFIHMECHHKGFEKYKCRVCSKLFSKEVFLKNHLLVHVGNRPFSCEKCGRSFASSGRLNAHEFVHLGRDNLIRDKVISKGVPRICVVWKAGGKDNVQEYTNINNASLTKSSPKMKMLSVLRFLGDSVVDKDKSVLNTKGSNISIYKNLLGDNGSRAVKCKGDLKKVMMRYKREGNTRNDMVMTRSRSVKTIRCRRCGEIFSFRNELAEHLKSCVKRAAWMCDKCGKSFKKKQAFMYHINHVHNGIKEHQCHICERWFSQKHFLRNHLRTHSGERPFVCDICGKTFSHSAGLYLHKVIHTGDYKYKCHICGVKSMSRYNMQKHLTIHTNEKNYVCNLCKMRFNTNKSLQCHKLIHAGLPPVTCTICGKKLKLERYLKYHMFTKHKEESVSNEEAISAANELVALDSEQC